MKVLILSDIHANYVALKTVIEAETDIDQILFLGDVVDYGTQPKACLDYIRGHADVAILGNHDRALAFDVDCDCRGDFRAMSLATRAWHQRLLSDEDRAYLRTLPVEAFVNVDGLKFYLTHAAPGDLSRYLDRDALIKAVSDIDADVVLVGHTHFQWRQWLGDRWVANPGSVGLSRDGGGVACYAVWAHGEIALKRLAYPVAQVIEELEQSPLQPGVKQSLIAVLTPRSA